MEDNHRNTFTADYRDSAFWAWMELGKPSMNQLLEVLPEDTIDNAKPTKDTLVAWRREDNWVERAEIIDKRVQRQLEAKYIAQKAEMYHRQAENAKKLQDKAMDWFEERDWNFSKPREALQAFNMGATIEQKTRGGADSIIALAQMRDDKLENVVFKLLSQASPEDVQEIVKMLTDGEDTDLGEIFEGEIVKDA